MVASTEVVASSLLPFCPAEQGTGGVVISQPKNHPDPLLLLLLCLRASPVAMALLSRLRLVTVDVTGTLIAYRGQLGDYYCTAARSAGLPCPGYARMHQAFKAAYADMTTKHPCFGHASRMPDHRWWNMCVRDSFLRAGHEYDDDAFERIFGQIYAAFGSPAPYSVFPDAQPFLRWLRGDGIMAGVVTNADCRYRDVVLPALGLNQGSEWDFGVFSGVAGVEKPDRRIYEMALEAAGGVAPEEALHIGDSMSKDYAPARAVGMHALLLDRFGTADAQRWRRSGAVVLPDLVSAREWLTRDPPPPQQRLGGVVITDYSEKQRADLGHE